MEGARAFKLSNANSNALLQALYNAAANVCVVIAGCAIVALYYVLESFLRPLIWAVLCGSFLHPFKYSVTQKMRNWLENLEKSGTPILFGLLVIPVKILDVSSESLLEMIHRNWRTIASVALMFFSLYAAYHYVPSRQILYIVQAIAIWIYQLLSYFSYKLVLALVAVYVGLLTFYWSPESKRLVQVLSIPLWILVICCAISSTGAFQVPLAVIFALFMVLGAYADMRDAKEKHQKQRARVEKVEDDVLPFEILSSWMGVFSDHGSKSDSTEMSSSKSTLGEQSDTEDTALAEEPSSADCKSPEVKPSRPTIDVMQPSPSIGQLGSPAPSSAADGNAKMARRASDRCFIALFWAIALVELWFNVWLVITVVLFVVFLGLKRVGQRVKSQLIALLPPLLASPNPVANWLHERRDALMPPLLRGLTNLILRGDTKIRSLLDRGADTLITIMFIVLLFLCFLVGTFLVLVQVQKEGLHLVTLTSNIVRNSTVQPEWLSRYLLQTNSSGFQEIMDPMVTNLYVHGREWIISEIEGFLSSSSHGGRELLEQRALTVWDSIYESWATRNATPISHRVSMFSSAQDGGFNFMFENFNIDFTSAVAFVKENIGTFISVFESVWSVVKGNLNLAFSFGSSLLQLIFGGGSAILNFVVSLIVFVTTLFLLLSSSGRLYKPVEWITLLSVSKIGGKFGQAVEDGIGGVFAATIKMATFYGLYTWLTHTVFGINLVFLPSVLAAIFGAIPFIGTYWAALPAMLELWLVHGEIFLALLLSVGHILPTLFVDTVIYRDIRGGGHPYLTGLAIAGGVYCFGLQGAIVGPVVLCCVIVAMNVYSNMLTSQSPAVLTPSVGDTHGGGGTPLPSFTAGEKLADVILSRPNSSMDLQS